MSLMTTEIRGHVAYLTLNRPESMNALGLPGDGDQIAEACNAVNANWDIRCVVLTGAGRAFSAGGDVKAMQEKRGPFSGNGIQLREMYRTSIHKTVRAIFGLEVPVVAAVNGPAIGLGCDIACMADMRIASDKAKFGVTFLRLGIIPGDGGAWLLPRTIGMSRASELFYTADVVDARTAKDYGLVSQVVPADELIAAATTLAERIAQQPPHSLRLTKSLLRQGQTNDLPTILELSAAAQALSHQTEDHMEGVNALLEKREPDFKGR